MTKAFQAKRPIRTDFAIVFVGPGALQLCHRKSSYLVCSTVFLFSMIVCVFFVSFVVLVWGWFVLCLGVLCLLVVFFGLFWGCWVCVL